MLRFGIQIEKKHGFGVVDSHGLEFHVTVTVASYGYPFHRFLPRLTAGAVWVKGWSVFVQNGQSLFGAVLVELPSDNWSNRIILILQCYLSSCSLNVSCHQYMVKMQVSFRLAWIEFLM